jgi:hypothetical protein
VKDILNLKKRTDFCPHCKGTGRISQINVGFTLHVGDVVVETDNEHYTESLWTLISSNTPSPHQYP